MDTNRNCGRNILLLTAAGAAAWLSLASSRAQTAPSITQQPASQAVKVGSNATFSVSVAGTGPFFYEWQFNGSNVAVITTVAGNGSNGYSGNGGPATNAALGWPSGVALDNSGNLYIADFADEVVRKVTNGVISTVAGNGQTNYSGDGLAAINTAINPASVALDVSGDIFIADYTNSRVRKVGLNGLISTVAGNGTNGFSGDGGKATNAELSYPAAILVDAASNLYIADFTNNRIRVVGTNGLINTIAGSGSNAFFGDGGPATNASLWHPAGLALDASSNLYIADSQNFRVRKVGSNGLITTVAGNGVNGPIANGAAATNTPLGLPGGLAVDAIGNLYIADSSNQCILEVSPSGLLTIVAGVGTNGFSGDGGPAIGAELSSPSDVSVDAFGDLFIADAGNSRIREVIAPGPSLALFAVTSNNAGDYDVVVSSLSGVVTSIDAVLSVGFAPGLTNVTGSEAVAIGSNVTLSATATSSGPFLYQWQFNGTNLPTIITTVAGNGQDGESGDAGQAVNAELYAGAVAVDALGDFFIADSAHDRVRQVSAGGIISTVAGNGSNGFFGDGGPASEAWLYNPVGVALDGMGNLYIADEGNNRVRQVNTNGVISTVAGNGTSAYSGDGAAATNASLSHPTGVAVDASGNLYIADQGNNRIRKVGANGVITTLAGSAINGFAGDGGPAVNASLSHPADVAVDGLGNVFIADSGNKRIRKVGNNGIIITVAGNGDSGYYGDGGPATNAFFEAPACVAVDGFGNVYIADGTEHVREVGLNGIISSVTGNAGSGYSGDGGAATNAMLDEVYGLAPDASGNLYLADTGNNRIREIKALGPALPLGSFNLGEAGNYDLIVSNPFGSVTSAVIMVTAPVGPLAPLTASLSGSNILAILFIGTPGSNYVLQTTTNLAPPANWQPVATNAAGTNGSGSFNILYLLANPASFYRLALP
jgi:sugar lactone lactonase YvrE